MSTSHKGMGVMGKSCSCMQFIKSCIFYCKSRENPYQYYKSREIEGSYDKIIITIVPGYTGKNITRLLPLALRTRNNTDGNKLVIFFGIASYNGDNYILATMEV